MLPDCTVMESNTFPSASCDLCSELFTDPRMLQCLHSFCNKCLQKRFEEQGLEQSLTCPTCNQAASIPIGGVMALPKDFRRSYESEVSQYEARVKRKADVSCDRCIEPVGSCAVTFCCSCCKFLCAQCQDDHRRGRETCEHELVEMGETKNKVKVQNLRDTILHKPVKCEFHPDEVLKLYCETCSSLICCECIVFKHVGHKYDYIESLAKKKKADLISLVRETESAAAKIDDTIAQGEKMKQRVRAMQKSVEEAITQTFNSLHKALYSREETLKTTAAEIGLSKCTALDIQKEGLEKVRNETQVTCKMITSAIQVYTPTEMLSAKDTMTNKLLTHMEKFGKCLLEPCKNDMMPCRLDDELLTKEIAAFGSVTGGCYAGCSTAAVYIPRAIKGREREVVITARNLQGELYPHGGEVVRSSLSLMASTDSPVVGKVVDKQDGTYVISFTPQAVGEHELVITIGNEPIKQNPFVFSVREPRVYASISSCQQYFHVSKTPASLACDDNGDVYVVEFGYHCVSVFNKSGSKIRTIGNAGKCGSGDGQFSYPSAIAINGDMIYVTEKNNHRIQKISISGKFISKFGSYGTDKGQLNYPCGVCVDPGGKVYVSERKNNRVSVFSADGTFEYHITGDSADESDLSSPWGVAFDPSGNLHVANHNLNVVKVFTSQGKYITQYGNGTLTKPSGIAIDADGYCFVTEDNGTTSRLLIFGPPEYKLIHTVEAFNRVVGVYIDKEGYVYISDYNNNRVAKY